MSGMPKREVGPALHRRTRSVDQSMTTNAFVSVESDDTTAEPTTEQDHRALDWGTETPVRIENAVVIFVDAYARTDDGAALRFDGDTPTHIVDCGNLIPVADALSGAGYSRTEIQRADTNGQTMELRDPETVAEAVRVAEVNETRAQEKEIATDGGVAPLDVRCRSCGEDYQLTTETGNDCPECGFVDFEVRQ